MDNIEADEGFNTEVLLGKTLEDAATLAAPFGYHVRATRKNGHPAIVTRDYRIDRINVVLTDGKITDVLDVG